MTAEEKENTQTKSTITIPAGAMVILPLRNTVLFPSTIMPLAVGRRKSLQVVEHAVCISMYSHQLSNEPNFEILVSTAHL